MVDEEALMPTDGAAPKPAAEVARPAARKTKSRSKKAAGETAASANIKVAKPNARRLSAPEKLAKIEQIDADTAKGALLKDAVKVAGISDQTYYQWKKAVVQPTAERLQAAPADDELADFIRLEEENQRLRKLLSEKLRAENSELRRKLGIS